ncbi:MAG: MaoC/PaaZ C-terminal domain-containing protein [Halobacteria archaeon]
MAGHAPSWDKVKEGDATAPLKKGPITREEIKAYGLASGDTNPIHMDEKAGVMAGLGGVIQHGLRSMAFMSQMLTDWAGAPDRLKKIDVQFRAMVRPGDVVTSTGKITRKYQANGQKLVDVDLLQEARTPVGKGSGSAWPAGTRLVYKVVKEEKTPEKKKIVDFSLVKEGSNAPALQGKFTQFDANVSVSTAGAPKVEWAEALFRGWLKDGDALTVEAAPGGFEIVRKSNSILGKATVALA